MRTKRNPFLRKRARMELQLTALGIYSFQFFIFPNPFFRSGDKDYDNAEVESSGEEAGKSFDEESPIEEEKEELERKISLVDESLDALPTE
jgi:hypothetical protein